MRRLVLMSLFSCDQNMLVKRTSLLLMFWKAVYFVHMLEHELSQLRSIVVDLTRNQMYHGCEQADDNCFRVVDSISVS